MKVQFRKDSDIIFETNSNFQYSKDDVINIKDKPYIVKMTNKLILDDTEMLIVFLTDAKKLLLEDIPYNEEYSLVL